MKRNIRNNARGRVEGKTLALASQLHAFVTQFRQWLDRIQNVSAVAFLDARSSAIESQTNLKSLFPREIQFSGENVLRAMHAQNTGHPCTDRVATFTSRSPQLH